MDDEVSIVGVDLAKQVSQIHGDTAAMYGRDVGRELSRFGHDV